MSAGKRVKNCRCCWDLWSHLMGLYWKILGTASCAGSAWQALALSWGPFDWIRCLLKPAGSLLLEISIQGGERVQLVGTHQRSLPRIAWACRKRSWKMEMCWWQVRLMSHFAAEMPLKCHGNAIHGRILLEEVTTWEDMFFFLECHTLCQELLSILRKTLSPWVTTSFGEECCHYLFWSTLSQSTMCWMKTIKLIVRSVTVLRETVASNATIHSTGISYGLC